MIKSACLGFSRIGANNEIPIALRKFLDGDIGETELTAIATNVKRSHWNLQKKSGIDYIPSNDFSFCDHVLDAICLFGNVHRRYYWEGGKVPLSIYFAMIKGQQKEKFDVLPLEMEHWFNTNYMYFVPEIADPIDFHYSDNKPILDYLDARTHCSIETRPVIIGPVSYLLLSKSKEEDIKPLDVIDDLLKVYEELFINFNRIGIKDVQIDEPYLSTDLSRDVLGIFKSIYQTLEKYSKGINLHLTTYYGDIRDNLETMIALPVKSLHIDVPNNINFMDDICKKIPTNYHVSLGLVDANNIWINDITQSVDIAGKFIDRFGSDNVIISTSSSLFLCPFSKNKETKIGSHCDPYLSFIDNKLAELKLIKNILNLGKSQFIDEIKKNKKLLESKFFEASDKSSEENEFNKIFDNKNKVNDNDKFNHKARKEYFKSQFKLPDMPATLVGSLPNDENNDKNLITKIADIKKGIKANIELQEKSKLDIITFGELEKDTADEYYNLALHIDNIICLHHNLIPRAGYDFYYPYIICSNIKMTRKSVYLKSAIFSQSAVEKKPIKVILPGPISFVNHAFIPTWISIHDLYQQAAVVVRQEFASLAENNIKFIQIDELDLFSRLSFRISEFNQSLRNILSILSFVYYELNKTIHTSVYIGYFNFSDSIEELCKMEIDALFIESARSFHEILSSFVSFKPQIDIGLGLFDLKDSRMPTDQEMLGAIKKIMMFFDTAQLWLIPDCDFLLRRTTKDVTKILSTMSKTITEGRRIAAESDKV